MVSFLSKFPAHESQTRAFFFESCKKLKMKSSPSGPDSNFICGIAGKIQDRRRSFSADPDYVRG